MKRILLVLVFLVLAAGAYFGWQLFGPVVKAPEGKYFYINTGTSFTDMRSALLHQNIIPNGFVFDQVSKRADFTLPKPGRYTIDDGSSLVELVRMLKHGRQSPVRLVITKLRTKEDLAGRIGKNFEADSADMIRILLNNDSLKTYGVDTHTVMTLVIPNTYEVTWNGTPDKFLKRLKTEHDKFWNEERRKKAASKGLSPEQVYTMASIVDEETNKRSDKPLIASVYMNRIRKGMKLEADPTVKYAMRAFGLTRIYFNHLKYDSPYNTYQYAGLPPGPICTPSIESIDAVLEAPETDYIFFVAKPDFKGYSNFASTYEQHKVYANMYRKALDSLVASKNR